MFEKEDDTFEHIFQNYHDGVLMLDDCKQYMKANTTQVPGLTDILIEYRHSMIDVFLVVHGPGQLPPKIWDHASGVIVMATARLLSKSDAGGIEAYDEIIAAQRRVNERYRQAVARNDGSEYGIHEYIQI